MQRVLVGRTLWRAWLAPDLIVTTPRIRTSQKYPSGLPFCDNTRAHRTGWLAARARPSYNTPTPSRVFGQPAALCSAGHPVPWYLCHIGSKALFPTELSTGIFDFITDTPDFLRAMSKIRRRLCLGLPKAPFGSLEALVPRYIQCCSTTILGRHRDLG